jgi:hypothetical protein
LTAYSCTLIFSTFAVVALVERHGQNAVTGFHVDLVLSDADEQRRGWRALTGGASSLNQWRSQEVATKLGRLFDSFRTPPARLPVLKRVHGQEGKPSLRITRIRANQKAAKRIRRGRPKTPAEIGRALC